MKTYKLISCLTIFGLMALSNPQSALAETTPSWELRTAPLALFVKWVTLETTYLFSEKWAVGPSVIYYGSNGRGGMFSPGYNGLAAGISANYYFKGAFTDSWYLTGRYYYEDYTSRPHGGDRKFEVIGQRGQLVSGYKWINNRAGFRVGFGFDFFMATKTQTKGRILSAYEDGSAHGTYWAPVLEFKMDWQI